MYGKIQSELRESAEILQLRTDKIQCLSEDMLEKIRVQMECGLSWEEINKRGGINVSKLMAYSALNTSATDPWDFDIDRCIVVDDFEAPVTGEMKYIKPDYSFEIGQQTVTINHCDGAGMMLPCVSTGNFMVRGPWIKGLLSCFDYLKFCEVNHVAPKIKDVWGMEHDLIQENIQVIFTKSQMKMYKYYDSWQAYKDAFKTCGCHLCRTNYEEDWIADTTINYQMLQTLVDFTDEEIHRFTEKEHRRIEALAADKYAMLRTLKAEFDADDPYRQALFLYPELLREAYSRQTLKDVKKRMLLDAKSGKIRCQNKRLFAIPDFYAACQFWFQGIKEPEGLLKTNEIACKIYRQFDRADVLRSPHLYMEHFLCDICKDKHVYDWFQTNGVYTSVKSLISRVLQFDCDGDQLNVVTDPIIVQVADRNLKEHNVLPLFYDATKADPETISLETMFHGLKRAHDYSGIGQVSNSLTKLWNRNEPDWDAAAWLCYYNNLVIDAAKTGKINGYDKYPEINSRINKATGGKNGKLPYFFQFSKNGRKNLNDRISKRKTYSKPNNSIMNRLCARFDDIGNINMNYAGVPPFNWQMMMPSSECVPFREAVQTFCMMDDANLSCIIEAKNIDDLKEKENMLGYEILKESIIHELNALCGDYRKAYPAITKHLFTGENMEKPSHKQMYWRVFGDLAVQTLQKNLQSFRICSKCNIKLPSWVDRHICSKDMKGFFECIDCGELCIRTSPRQCRCDSCKETHRKLYMRDVMRKYMKKKRADKCTTFSES